MLQQRGCVFPNARARACVPARGAAVVAGRDESGSAARGRGGRHTQQAWRVGGAGAAPRLSMHQQGAACRIQTPLQGRGYSKAGGSRCARGRSVPWGVTAGTRRRWVRAAAAEARGRARRRRGPRPVAGSSLAACAEGWARGGTGCVLGVWSVPCFGARVGRGRTRHPPLPASPVEAQATGFGHGAQGLPGRHGTTEHVRQPHASPGCLAVAPCTPPSPKRTSSSNGW